MKIILTESQYRQITNYIGEQRVSRDKSNTDDIIKSFEDKGHYKWFDVNNLNVFPPYVTPQMLEYSLKKTLNTLSKTFGYSLRRVVVKDKGEIVGYLIWSDKGGELDDLGDGQTYSVILATAIHPDYRRRGLFKMMINKSNIQKPYLVQTSVFSPDGFWGKMGCEAVKDVGNGNTIEKCN